MKRLSLIAVLLIINLVGFGQTIKETQDWLKVKIETYGGHSYGILGDTYCKVEYKDSLTMIIKEYSDTTIANIYIIDFSSIMLDKLDYKIKKKGGIEIYLYGKCSIISTIQYSDNDNIILPFDGNTLIPLKPSSNPQQLAEKFIKAIKHFNFLLTGVDDDMF